MQSAVRVLACMHSLAGCKLVRIQVFICFKAAKMFGCGRSGVYPPELFAGSPNSDAVFTE